MQHTLPYCLADGGSIGPTGHMNFNLWGEFRSIEKFKYIHFDAVKEKIVLKAC